MTSKSTEEKVAAARDALQSTAVEIPNLTPDQRLAAFQADLAALQQKHRCQIVARAEVQGVVTLLRPFTQIEALP